LELRDFVRALRRHWVGVLCTTALVVLLAGILTLLTPATYTSETKLFVATQSSGSVQELQQGNTFTQARVRSYIETIDTPAVLQPVIDSLGIEETPEQLAGRVTGSADLNTVLISISTEDSSPVQAAALAEATATSLIAVVGELESTTEGTASPIKLSVVAPATAPAGPSAPDMKVNLSLALLIGLALGIGYGLVRSTLDNRIRSEADLQRIADLPLLGRIHFDEDAEKRPLLTQAAHQSPRGESFRQLRTNLQFAHVNHHSKAILVTSSLPGEGKSTTATNLAISIAQAGQSVVLVDADLRRPRIDEYLGLERGAGLTTALIGRAKASDLLQRWGSGEMYVLTSGQIPPNPSELLGSSAMSDLIAELERDYDAVVIDAPPLLPVTDGAVLAQKVGGVVLVVGASKVRTTDVEKALSALHMVEAELLGVVMNRLPTKGVDAYSYSYYSYNSKVEAEEETKPRAARRAAKNRPSDFDTKVLGMPAEN
jgi:capsular exopolysaccharide synthesis family protein